MGPAIRFDLNRELARWQQALGAREGLTGERVRELEDHLQETMAQWRAKGLTVEESFWIAAHRMGDADALSRQFAQADTAGIWRVRIFWMLIGILVIPLLQFVTSVFGGVAIYFCMANGLPVPGSFIALLASGFFIGGLLLLFHGLAGGRWPRLSQYFEAFCSRRRGYAWQLLLLALAPMTVGLIVMLALWWLRANGWMADFSVPGSPDVSGLVADMRKIFIAQSTLWPLALAVLAAKYAPVRPVPLNVGEGPKIV